MAVTTKKSIQHSVVLHPSPTYEQLRPLNRDVTSLEIHRCLHGINSQEKWVAVAFGSEIYIEVKDEQIPGKSRKVKTKPGTTPS